MAMHTTSPVMIIKAVAHEPLMDVATNDMVCVCV